MSKVKIKLNDAGIKQLLKSSEMQSICMEHARNIQQRAGDNYEVGERHYPERNGAAVYPSNDDGYYDNLHNNTLLKAMGK